MKALNPSTGNLEEVYVKALDSLPVGSEIDFIGSASDIPTGWEQVSDYSTSEVNTGKTWIDGKPIYRIVINKTSLAIPGGNGVLFAHGISNIDTITSFDTIFDLVGTRMINYIFDNDGYKVFSIDNTNINYWGTTSFSGSANRIWNFIVEYTKTTD